MLTLACGLIITPAQAAEPPPELSLTQLRQALLALPPQTGRFLQRAPNGGLLRGTFALALPEKMRFAYEDEAQSIITVSGPWISVQEAPGAEANRYPVSVTPLQLMRDVWDKPISPANVKEILIEGGRAQVTLVDGDDGETAGLMTLVFEHPTMRLIGWQITDAQNLVTQFALTEVRVVDSLPNSRFFVQEDESGE